MKPFIGLDLGGTHIKGGLVNTESGDIQGFRQVDTLAREGYAAVILRMARLVEEIVKSSGLLKTEIGGVGIGVPGMLDLKRGMVLFTPNFPGNWLNVALRSRMQELTELHTTMLNDVRSMTLGEWTFGAGRGVDTVACFAIGTGIGGGLVINGRLHLGIDGSGGELGHQIIDMNGLPCGCGSQGCLEAYASGPAITAMGLKAVTQGLTTRIGALAEYDLNRITPQIIHQAALEGDVIAQDIFRRAGFYIGIAVASVIASVGPRRVIIGGGVARAGELLLESLRRTVDERVFMVPRNKVEIVPAELGVRAGMIGAAVWARHDLKGDQTG
jgi:glucokinase